MIDYAPTHFLELDKLELDKLLTGPKIAAVSTSAQRWGPETAILCGKELFHRQQGRAAKNADSEIDTLALEQKSLTKGLRVLRCARSLAATDATVSLCKFKKRCAASEAPAPP